MLSPKILRAPRIQATQQTKATQQDNNEERNQMAIRSIPHGIQNDSTQYSIVKRIMYL